MLDSKQGVLSLSSFLEDNDFSMEATAMFHQCVIAPEFLATSGAVAASTFVVDLGNVPGAAGLNRGGTE